MADAETERLWADLREAERIWNAVQKAKAFDRCSVIYQHKSKPLLYAMSVEGRVLLAWPKINLDRLDRRVDFHGLSKHGITLPKMGPFGISTHSMPSDASPIWLEDDVDAVPLFSLRGRGGWDSALLVADSIRADVRNSHGMKAQRIGLLPPDLDSRNPADLRVVSASDLAMRLSYRAHRKRMENDPDYHDPRIADRRA
ncbi:hypothetical protein M3D00_16655 [Dietzia cinnamea]|uniref:hypothetical protein n=1 Tax=Dietzia cinnamea TaxID=321318 RepID=UPI0021A3097E|nr:hypothetical protein [Dietzia cinnamea]MCT2031763.1 hypothetical protein [Dietzia cinnamea]